MKATPQNKMITTNDENIKEVTAPKLGKQMQSWYFPHEGKSIVAETFEEACAIINKEKVK